MNTVPLYLEKDFGSTNRLFLMLGPACNMCCRHCVENPQKQVLFTMGLNATNLKIDEKVLLLIENFIKNVKKGKPKIVFWGGEPLLYWNTICKVTEYIFEKCKGFDYILSITTNGLLITDDKIDFLNQHNFMVHFSYDAPYPWAVRDYVSDEICDKMKKIRGLRILTGYCAYNCDPMLAHSCLLKKFPNVPIDFSVFLGHSFAMPEDIYAWNWDMIYCALRKLRIGSQLGNRMAYMYLLTNFGLARGNSIWDNSITYSGVRKKCVAGYDKLCVTSNGDIISCHVGSKIIGSIYDNFALLKEKASIYTASQSSSQCATCRHIGICLGNRCYLNLKEPDGSYVFCKGYYLPFFDALKKELLKLSSPLSDIDIKWYEEQMKITDQQVDRFLLEGQRYEKEHTRFPIECFAK